MGGYDFEKLGWYNFEQLARLLLREIVGHGISVFSGSADQCRDATFCGESTSFPSTQTRWNGNWIFQVKHRSWGTRGVSNVRTELKSTVRDELTAILSKHN